MLFVHFVTLFLVILFFTTLLQYGFFWNNYYCETYDTFISNNINNAMMFINLQDKKKDKKKEVMFEFYEEVLKFFIKHFVILIFYRFFLFFQYLILKYYIEFFAILVGLVTLCLQLSFKDTNYF